MTVEGCSRVMKYILVGFNVLVMIAGGIAIGLGAWALASDYGAEKLKNITGSDLYLGACIVIIVGGCIIVALSFLGCCGALCENRVMLGIYFVIMLLFLILFVVVAALGFFFRDDIREELEKQMESTLVEKYGVDDPNNSDSTNAVTDVWDDLQKTLGCCGVSGGRNSSKSWFLWQSSQWFMKQTSTLNKNYVPNSCCKNASAILDKCTELNTNPKAPVQNSTEVITEDNSFLYQEGCVDKLEDKIREHIIAIAAIAIVVLIVMFLCIIFSVCVCMEVGKQSMVV